MRELDRLNEDLAMLDKEFAESALDDPAIKRLITITGVNLTVAAGLVAAIGDIPKISKPPEAGELFRPQSPRPPIGSWRRASWPHQQGRARAMLVEAAWAAAKAPGPLHAFFVRIRAKRGHQIAAVALARKLAVLCWHLLTKDVDYLWARPALVANKVRAMELQAGQKQKKGNRRGPTYAYNVKELRDQEMEVARRAEVVYEHFVKGWKPTPPRDVVRGRLKPARLE